MSSSGSPASDPSSEGKLPESVSSDEAMNCRPPAIDPRSKARLTEFSEEIFDWNRRPPASDPRSEARLTEVFEEIFDGNRRPSASNRPCETKLRQNVDWSSRPGASDRPFVANLSDFVVDLYNRGQPKELEKHTEPLHLRKLGILKLVEEDTTPPSSEERISSCPEDTTPPSSEERIPIRPEDMTPASSEERISSCPEDPTPICPEDTTPICPADTTPTCPICTRGRHWMSFCPYLRRVPDDVTNIGGGYIICCQVCSLYNNECGHNMAYATPVFCFVCRSREHFSQDCPEFKDVKG